MTVNVALGCRICGALTDQVVGLEYLCTAHTDQGVRADVVRWCLAQAEAQAYDPARSAAYAGIADEVRRR